MGRWQHRVANVAWRPSGGRVPSSTPPDATVATGAALAVAASPRPSEELQTASKPTLPTRRRGAYGRPHCDATRRGRPPQQREGLGRQCGASSRRWSGRPSIQTSRRPPSPSWKCSSTPTPPVVQSSPRTSRGTPLTKRSSKAKASAHLPGGTDRRSRTRGCEWWIQTEAASGWSAFDEELLRRAAGGLTRRLSVTLPLGEPPRASASPPAGPACLRSGRRPLQRRRPAILVTFERTRQRP